MEDPPLGEVAALLTLAGEQPLLPRPSSVRIARSGGCWIGWTVGRVDCWTGLNGMGLTDQTHPLIPLQQAAGPRAEASSGGEEEGTEHPHVLPLIEALVDGRHLYLVFPYADGGELFEVRCLGRHAWVIHRLRSCPFMHIYVYITQTNDSLTPLLQLNKRNRRSPAAPPAWRRRRRVATLRRSSRASATCSGTGWRTGAYRVWVCVCVWMTVCGSPISRARLTPPN